MEFHDSKFCRIVEDHLFYQQGNKQLFCKYNMNFTISRVCLDLQYYKPINISFKNEELILYPELLLDYGLVHQIVCSDPNQANNFGRKVVLWLIQGFKMNKKFVDQQSSKMGLWWLSSVCTTQYFSSLPKQKVNFIIMPSWTPWYLCWATY